jgi:hypothetical protein
MNKKEEKKPVRLGKEGRQGREETAAAQRTWLLTLAAKSKVVVSL